MKSGWFDQLPFTLRGPRRWDGLFGAPLDFVWDVFWRRRGWKPFYPNYVEHPERIAAKYAADFIAPPTVSYDPYASFRADVIACDGPPSWITAETIQRAILLAEEETGKFPEPGNEGAQALIRYALIGRKIVRGATLTNEEQQIADKLAASESQK